MAVTDCAPLRRLAELLALAVARRASDLHLAPGLPPHVRLEGELLPLVDEPILGADELAVLGRAVVDAYAPSSDSFESRFALKGSIDGALTAGDGTRFRFNLFKRQRETGIVFRRLEDRFRPLQELGMPEALYNFCGLRDGLVIVSGPTGSGKSTTLAALLDRINRTRSNHIVTIEDPVEYIHKPVRCIVSQRQVGLDAPTFNDALVAALRQDPDVILLGEARDLDTIRTAITAAETGHLVFATLHAGDCAGSIERLTAVFPAAEQDAIRRQLALVLRAVVAQHLLPAAQAPDSPGGTRNERVAASEVMIVTAAISNLIVTGRSAQIASIMETGQSAGMQTLDQDLTRLLVLGRITEAAAIAISRNPQALRERVALQRKRGRTAPQFSKEAAR